MDQVWILAQTDSGQAPSAPSQVDDVAMPKEGEGAGTLQDSSPGTPTTPQRQGSLWMNMLPFVVIMVVMYVLMFRGPRKQQQQHKDMVQSLKKNDRVRTIGGIFGTIVDIRGEEVVLKVDEQSNTKIRVSTSAIGKNLSQEGKE